MLPFIRTLFDIALLRKGPEDIPRSWLLLYLSAALWLFAILTAAVLIESFDVRDVWIAVVSLLIGVSCYMGVLLVAGHSSRSLQTAAAIVGCGAVISFAQVLDLVMITPILGASLTDLVAWLLLFWSVPVNGHIIARAINGHWYAGIVIAMAIFLLEFTFTSAVTPEP